MNTKPERSSDCLGFCFDIKSKNDIMIGSGGVFHGNLERIFQTREK